MIELENVSFSYDGQEHDGLHDINLKILDGECVLFCGRSGCGKTTITRLVNGLIPQFYQGELHGRVLVDGQEISNLPMYQIAAKVGSVFQNPRTQFFNVDTDSEIAFGIENEARPPQELAERVEQTTEDLHIQKLRSRNIFELSGGEKQKIAFASVYAMNPKIYLLDEPSSNLDMTSIQELKEHLRLIKSQGKTILIAEHRLYYLMELADRIVYDTPTGENGNLLSGGERQRISIARAILKNSPILLLDEATASLDIENELAVKQAIANLLKEKKTVVMIAHTLSIVKNADQILVVSDGKIAEAGTHDELLAKGGKYAAMWNAEQKISA